MEESSRVERSNDFNYSKRSGRGETNLPIFKASEIKMYKCKSGAMRIDGKMVLFHLYLAT